MKSKEEILEKYKYLRNTALDSEPQWSVKLEDVLKVMEEYASQSITDEKIEKLANEHCKETEGIFTSEESFICGFKKALFLTSKEKEGKEEIKYGDYVQFDDRFKSVHIWSRELEIINAGRWKPIKISEEEYIKQKLN